jgi:ABC-type uncharacterized transport system ATPase subunit
MRHWNETMNYDVHVELLVSWRTIICLGVTIKLDCCRKKKVLVFVTEYKMHEECLFLYW